MNVIVSFFHSLLHPHNAPRGHTPRDLVEFNRSRDRMHKSVARLAKALNEEDEFNKMVARMTGKSLTEKRNGG